MNKFANNDSDSNEIFNLRKKYRDLKYPNGIFPIDFWYSNPFYGKIDSKQNSIFISETNLKQISSVSDTVFVADFVADAFEDFKSHVKRALIAKHISAEGFLPSLEPKNGWKSLTALHHNHVKEIYNSFIAFYVKYRMKDEQILSFEDFIRIFVNYFMNKNTNFPFTRTSFIQSKYCTPLISGLIIELENEDHSSDMVKIRKYIDDINFSFYQNTAGLYGFYIDKNAPWRLVSNISSGKMQKYMIKYGIKFEPETSSDLFEIYYYKAYLTDLDVFKEYLVQFYNTYVEKYPFVGRVELDDNEETIQNIIKRRKKISSSDEISQEVWIDVFYRIRVKEAELEITEKRKQDDIKELLLIDKYIGLDEVLRQINDKTKLNIIPLNDFPNNR